jgi:prepilin-type N-terminal cleavage/methylation domain-containing protein
MKLLSRLAPLTNHSRGFTLIETLIALLITGIVSLGVSMSVQQMLTINAMNNTRLTAVKQVENAVHYLSRDAQMAQVVQVASGSGFPLTLNWTEWDNTTNQVIYSIQNNQMQRSQSLNSGTPQVMVAARNIDTNSNQTNCQFSGGILTGKITAAVSGFKPSTESRSFKIIPRAAQ